MNTELNVMTNTSLFAPVEWKDTDKAVIYAGDIRHPWQSVHGFAMTAARLAANQELVLHCREDEVLGLLAKLNDLLAQPEVLNRTYTWLKKLDQEMLQKLSRLLEFEAQSIGDDETSDLLAQVEQFLTEPAQEQTAADRLQAVLSPNKPVEEIAGLRKMLARLQLLISTLERVKDQGFHVVARNRRRQPKRPALEARREELILQDGQPTALAAGFLQPPSYHSTLWSYVVVRGSAGQSAVWN